MTDSNNTANTESARDVRKGYRGFELAGYTVAGIIALCAVYLIGLGLCVSSYRLTYHSHTPGKSDIYLHFEPRGKIRSAPPAHDIVQWLYTPMLYAYGDPLNGRPYNGLTTAINRYVNWWGGSVNQYAP